MVVCRSETADVVVSFWVAGLVCAVALEVFSSGVAELCCVVSGVEEARFVSLGGARAWSGAAAELELSWVGADGTAVGVLVATARF